MDITAFPGIGASRAKLLAAMGINTAKDLLNCFPRDYDDRSKIKTIAMLNVGESQTIRGTIKIGPENIVFRQGAPLMTKITLSDDTGKLELLWFGQPYLKNNFKVHETYMFTGRVMENYGRLQMESPDYEKVTQGELLSAGRIVPIYTLKKGISQKMFRKWVRLALEAFAGEKDILPAVAGQVCTRSEAVKNIHFPESDEALQTARSYLVFEELFFMQSALLHIKGIQHSGVKINTDLNPFCDSLPFKLTAAQLKVLGEISKDFLSGVRMSRLIQGDVGSGKTVVAAACAYLVISAGYQAAIMAPTEILANQHFEKFSAFLKGFNVVLLTGSLTAKDRKAAYKAVSEGQAHMVIGTHALIQKAVNFKNLALVVTDEQHRFGVKQRSSLAAKGLEPHVLVMTATPIPRTLALILYGDMDISVIDSSPPGRKVIKTYYVNSSYRKRLYAFIDKLVREGRQIYIICPAIEESEADMLAVTTYTETLQKALPHISIACLHGRLKDKDEIMTAFSQGKYAVMVSTTVIEVGVDVPNAALMVIENAERFGLSQLHQLRGRVGRGNWQSYCVLVTDSRTGHVIERVKAMEATSDGFALSELDLKLRGPGDFFGVRQHGIPAFMLANLYRDMDILKKAQEAATLYYKAKDIPLSEKQETDMIIKSMVKNLSI